MTLVPVQPTGGGSSGLYDILELILDRGLVIDIFVRVSVIGIEVLRIDIRVVVASVDTYLRFAEACNRLDLEQRPRRTLERHDFAGELEEGRARSLTGIGERTAAPRKEEQK